MVAARDAARGRIQQRQAERSSSGRSEAQESSHRRYVGLSRADAVELAKQTFAIGSPAWQRPEQLDGGRAAEYLSDHLMIEESDGRRLLVASTVPMRALDASGAARPTSLRLVSRDDGDFAPEAPVVPVSFDGGPPGRISLPGNITATPVRSFDDVASATFVDSSVFYASVGRDTDFIVRAVPAGAEALWQLRSVDSPTENRLRFELPSGAMLRPAAGAPGAAEVVRDGERLLFVHAPSAVDAAGEPVPVSLQVLHGDTLVVRAELDQHVEFPVLVDPILDASFGTVNAVNAWEGWTSYASTGGWGLNRYYDLLQVIVDPAQGYYPVGAYGEWYARARGDAGIQRADIQNAAHSPAVQSNLFAGLYNGPNYVGTFSDNGYAGNTGTAPYVNSGAFANAPLAFCAANGGGSDYPGGSPLCDPNTSAPGFAFGETIDSGLSVSSNAQISGASLKYLDKNVPSSVSVSGIPSTWVTSLAALSVAGTDDGLGVRRFELKVGSNQPSPQYAACTQLRYFCPPSDTKSFPLSGLAEGRNWVTATVTDEVGNPTTVTPSLPVRIDRTAPILTDTGRLRTATTDITAPAALHVDADDGVDDGNPVNARSGVKSLTLEVDDYAVVTRTNATPCQNCGVVVDWTFDPAEWEPGEHDITVTVKDQLGHTTVDDWKVANEPNPPRPQPTPRPAPRSEEPSASPPNPTGDADWGEPTDDPDECTPDPDGELLGYCGELDALNLDLQAALDEAPLDPNAPEIPTMTTLDDPTDTGSYTRSSASTSATDRVRYWGLSDNHYQTFDETPDRPSQLGIRSARLIVAWDVAKGWYPNQSDNALLNDTENWLANVSNRGLRPLISFEHHPGEVPGPLPSGDEYRAAMDHFFAWLDDLRGRRSNVSMPDFTAWNEPNHPNQPTSPSHNTPSLKGITRAGKYWNILRGKCAMAPTTCVVAAGDFSDSHPMSRDLFKAYRNGTRKTPDIWALHTYSAGYRNRPQLIKTFLHRTGSKPIWLTEQGVRQDHDFNHTNGHVDHRKIRRNMTRLMREPSLSKRIRRFYYYQWDGNSDFDSGLINYVSHKRRAIYYQYKKRIP